MNPPNPDAQVNVQPDAEPPIEAFPLVVVPEVVEAPLPVEGKRRGILRRFRAAPQAGAQSLSQTVETEPVTEAIDDEGEYLFGLEDDLDQFRQKWRDHQTVIDDFMNPENQDHFDEVVTAQMLALPNASRNVSRIAKTASERDFPMFTTAAVVSGRLNAATDTGAYLHKRRGKRGYKELIIESGVTTGGDKLLFDMLTPESARGDGPRIVAGFADKLKDLRVASAKTYKRFIKSKLGIEEKLLYKMHQDPATADEILTTFAEAADSDSDAERTFTRLLATDHKEDPELSVLGVALKTLESEANQPQMVDGFLAEKFDPAVADNLLGFVVGQLEADQSFDMKAYIKERFADWPEALKAEYQDYVSSYVASKRLVCSKVANGSAAVKAWMLPEPQEYSDYVGKIYTRMRTAPKSGSRKSATAKGRTSQTLNLDSVISSGRAEAEAKPVPIELRDPQGNTDPRVIVENLMHKKHKRDTALVDDMETLLNGLAANSGGRGIEPTVRKTTIDGKKVKVYSLKGQKFSADTHTPYAKHARIVFARTNGTGHVLGIFPTHDDEYEEFLDTFPKK